MSPEYAMQGLFSDKSDVFSFGVLLLEIISGKKNNSYYDDDSVTLIGHVSAILWQFKKKKQKTNKEISFPIQFSNICNVTHATRLFCYSFQVWDLWKQGNSLDIVDPLLVDSYQEKEVMRCIHIGLLCVQEHASDRPTMAEVLSMLCNETTVSATSPSQPAYVIRKGTNYHNSSSTSVGERSVNEVTITTIHAR